MGREHKENVITGLTTHHGDRIERNTHQQKRSSSSQIFSTLYDKGELLPGGRPGLKIFINSSSPTLT
jgi:hypothetical protein